MPWPSVGEKSNVTAGEPVFRKSSSRGATNEEKNLKEHRPCVRSPGPSDASPFLPRLPEPPGAGCFVGLPAPPALCVPPLYPFLSALLFVPTNRGQIHHRGREELGILKHSRRFPVEST